MFSCFCIFYYQSIFKQHILFIQTFNKYGFSLSFFSHGTATPSGQRPPHCRRFTITLRHTTLGRTPLDEGSARRRDLYVTTYNTHKRQTSVTYGRIRKHNVSKRATADPLLDRAATGTGPFSLSSTNSHFPYTSFCV
jgi:hypothetical protein